MKKLLIVFAIIIAGLNAQAQKTFYTTHIRTATLNTYQNKWEWDEERAVVMMITMDNLDVYFDNKGKTHIRLIGSSVEKKVNGGTSTTWDAIDDKKDRCTISLVTWNDNSPWQIYLSYKYVRAAYTMSNESSK